jgi:hypothetical protein
MDIILSPSPNFDERKHAVDMLVLHYTGMETGQAAFDQLRNPAAKGLCPLPALGGWAGGPAGGRRPPGLACRGLQLAG